MSAQSGIHNLFTLSQQDLVIVAVDALDQAKGFYEFILNKEGLNLRKQIQDRLLKKGTCATSTITIANFPRSVFENIFFSHDVGAHEGTLHI